MTTIRRALALLCVTAAAVLAHASCGGERDPGTPAEAAARGDQLLRQVSDTLKNARLFSFTSNESHERVRRNGEKATYTLRRQVIVRRPDRLFSHTTSSDGRDSKVTYDGKSITLVGDTHKIYARVDAPSTLDETLDLISHRYDFRLAVADVLYSSPYDSFAGKESTGGWVRRVTVDGRECEEVSYQMPAVDFTLSVTAAEPRLPCQLQITYKVEPGKPVSRLVFSDWNLQATAEESQFVARVPEGYERIPVVERIPKDELEADPAKAMGAADSK